MGRPRKGVSSARKNGANATNKGKRVSEAARCIVMNDNSMLERRAAAAGGVPAMLRALSILEREIQISLALTGVSDVSDLHPGLLVRDQPLRPSHVLSAFPLLEEGY